ncbi:MAG TPA: response regulator transcription factor [Bacteroidota bacterium]|jgi:DNA-binding response OmpR family regulator
MKILVAEDDPASRLVLTTALKKLGHEVVATENGRDAWRTIGELDIRMVISDWMMPYIDGVELCKMIRAQHSKHYVYVILLTALAGKGNYLQGMSAGADDLVTKPFDLDELAARLRVGERILSLEHKVSRLEGLLPICAYCKNIRDENNNWHQMEHYIVNRSDAEFTHGVCPDCLEKMRGQRINRNISTDDD